MVASVDMHASLGRARLVARFVRQLVVLGLLAGAAVSGLGACSHAGGRPPVDSPIYAFQPVDPDEYNQDTDDDDDDSGDTGGSDDASDGNSD